MLNDVLKKFTLTLLDKPVRYILSRANIHQDVNNKLVILESMLQDSYPDEWIINDRSAAEITKIKSIFNLPENTDMSISKNDMMFRFFINNNFTIPETFKAYLVRSVHFIDLLSTIATQKWGENWQKKAYPFLDFASGYGAFERLLINQLPPGEIYTADIKKKGVDFQVKHFGVNGLYSSLIPEDFKSSTQFKFIYVASLFSHLPVETFSRWLQVLWKLVDKEGLLVFTVHDVSLSETKKDFVFVNSSEDKNMNHIDDSLLDSNHYGVTYVDEDFIVKQLKELGLTTENYCRYPRAFCGLQDVYIFSHERSTFDPSIKFKNFDSSQY